MFGSLNKSCLYVPTLYLSNNVLIQMTNTRQATEKLLMFFLKEKFPSDSYKLKI